MFKIPRLMQVLCSVAKNQFFNSNYNSNYNSGVGVPVISGVGVEKLANYIQKINFSTTTTTTTPELELEFLQHWSYISSKSHVLALKLFTTLSNNCFSYFFVLSSTFKQILNKTFLIPLKNTAYGCDSS
jgi:hypothetical protein